MGGENLTVEERACNYETMRHIERVRNLLGGIIKELLRRGEMHDQSKLRQPEVALFAEYTPKLAACTYGSEEYEGFRKAMGAALSHHYANNRHHPEHHKHGIDGMNLVDLIEMFCDWFAAASRHVDGDPVKSIEISQARFGLSDQLKSILLNSLELFRD